MTTRQRIIVLVLFALIVLAVTTLILTHDSSTPASLIKARRGPIVDERPVQTARSMAALASTRDEQRLAQQALRLADHSVDLAFVDAMREATLSPSARTPRPRNSSRT